MERKDHQFVALGGPCNIVLFGPDAGHLEQVMAAATTRLEAFEEKYSRYRQHSEVSRINRSAGQGLQLTVDEETCALIDYAFVCYQQSDGLFDITSGVLRRAWDFESAILPDRRAVDAMLPLIGLEKILWSAPSIELPIAGLEVPHLVIEQQLHISGSIRSGN